MRGRGEQHTDMTGYDLCLCSWTIGIGWIGPDIWPMWCRSVQISARYGTDWCIFSLGVGAPVGSRAIGTLQSGA